MRKLLEGRPLGLPLHALIVHLPVGLWFMSLVFDAMAKDMLAIFNRGWILHTEPWPEKCAFLCVAGGSIVALLAIITGFNDWLGLRENHPAQKTALAHMACNMAGTAVFIADTGVRWRQIHHLTPSVTAATLSLVGFGLILIGGYLGWRMVFRHGVGVRRHRDEEFVPECDRPVAPTAPDENLPAV